MLAVLIEESNKRDTPRDITSSEVGKFIGLSAGSRRQRAMRSVPSLLAVAPGRPIVGERMGSTGREDGDVGVG